jgi:sugar phosphate isomerase/epimerase
MPYRERLISLDHPTTPGLDPLQTVALAHELGCDAVVLRLRNYPDYASHPYDAVADKVLRRRVRDAAAERGIVVAAANALEIRAGVPVASQQPMLEAAADIGARAVSLVVYDTDRGGHVERVAEFAERAHRLGLRTLLEFFALSGVDSLGYTLELIGKLGHPGVGISADSLHFTRTGTTIAQLAAVPHGWIGHGQLNDGPAFMPPEQQLDEARGERLLPGEGEFDLVGFVRALPADLTIGVEAGTRSKFARGVTMEEHGRAAVAAMRRVLDAAAGKTTKPAED